MVLTVYKLDASPPARAVVMLLKALHVDDVEYIDVNLLEGHHLKEEFIKINPQHTVPTLVDDDFAIWDSHAIAGYLVGKYAKNDSLYPNEPKRRAIIDQRLHFDSGILFPALRGTVEPVFFWGEPALKEENLAKIKSAYNFLEDFLTDSWIAGDHLSIADICCAATTSNLDTIIPIDEVRYPKITAWLKKMAKLDYYAELNEPGVKAFRELLKSKLG